MIEQGEFYLAMIGLFVLYIILSVRSDAKLLDLLEELAFPSDDPIMTSELDRGKPVFDYTTIEEEEEIPLDDTPEEAVELTPEEEEVIEEVMAGEEPEETEVFDYDEAPEEPELRQSKIPFLQPDFPWVTLSQLKRLPKADLIDLCEKYEKKTDGTKADLVKRLID